MIIWPVFEYHPDGKLRSIGMTTYWVSNDPAHVAAFFFWLSTLL